MIDGIPAPGPASAAVLAEVEAVMRPKLRASGPAELRALRGDENAKPAPDAMQQAPKIMKMLVYSPVRSKAKATSSGAAAAASVVIADE